MAQDGFMLSDEGRTITVLNDSGTTAIDAGDLCYVGTNDDVLTATAASARNAYDGASDIKVFSIAASATGYQTIVGVALEDIPADGVGSMAMEGMFIHQVNSNTEAGDLLQGDEAAANKLDTLDAPAAGSTTTNADATLAAVKQKIGRALTGGSADTKYIIWKLAL